MNANQRVKLPQNVRVSITRKLLHQNAGFVGQLRAIPFHGTIVIVMPSKDHLQVVCFFFYFPRYERRAILHLRLEALPNELDQIRGCLMPPICILPFNEELKEVESADDSFQFFQVFLN